MKIQLWRVWTFLLVIGLATAAWAAPLPAPTDIALFDLTSATAGFTWRHPGAESFEIWRQDNPGQPIAPLTVINGGSRYFRDQGLRERTTYRYAVRALGAANDDASPLSLLLTVTTPPHTGKIAVIPKRVKFPRTFKFERREVPVVVTNRSPDTWMKVGLIGFEPGDNRGEAFRLDLPDGYSEMYGPGQEQTLKLVFAPEARGRFRGLISIHSSDPRRPVVRIRVTGSAH